MKVLMKPNHTTGHNYNNSSFVCRSGELGSGEVWQVHISKGGQGIQEPGSGGLSYGSIQLRIQVAHKRGAFSIKNGDNDPKTTAISPHLREEP
jgi:hypothetical protein